MQKILNKIINILKWPIAVYMLLSLPALVASFDYFRFATFKFAVFFGGAVFYAFTRSIADKTVTQGMQTIAHELTHSFFALITFHKLKHIRLNDDDSGGSMGFEGEGNWLIIIAPYFFPLFVFFFMIAVAIFGNFGQSNLILTGVFGYMCGYHLDTVASQIHDKQTDLPKVNYWFCGLFLPGANLWVIGSMLAFNSKGWDGIWLYSGLINTLNIRNLSLIF